MRRGDDPSSKNGRFRKRRSHVPFNIQSERTGRLSLMNNLFLFPLVVFALGRTVVSPALLAFFMFGVFLPFFRFLVLFVLLAGRRRFGRRRRRLGLALRTLLLALLSGLLLPSLLPRLPQLLPQFPLTQLRQRRDVILVAIRAGAAHVQHDLLVGVDLDEVAALIG